MTSFHPLRTENIKALPSWLVRYDSALLEVSSSELRDYLLALVNALFFKAGKQEELFDTTTAKQALTDAKRLQNLLGVAESAIGTHNLKYPNANVGQGAVFAPAGSDGAVRAVDYPWVSSRTTQLTRTVGGAGNAAWAAEIRFLCTEFMLDGELVRMADVLATRAGQVWETLNALGLQQADADRVGSVLRARLSQPDQGAIDPLSKQVFFPLRDADDVVITPVQHLGLAREFHTRFFRRISKDNPDQERFNVRALKVGGANPINAGPYNAELGGLYRHLLAEVPARFTVSDADRQFDDRGRRLLVRLKQRQTVFPRPSQLEIDVTALLQPAMEGRQNKLNRKLFAAAATNIAEQLLEDAFHLSAWLVRQETSLLLDDDYTPVADLLKRWLDPRLRPSARLGGNELDRLVDVALGVYLEAYRYQLTAESQKIPASPSSLFEERLLRDSLRQLIEEFGS